MFAYRKLLLSGAAAGIISAGIATGAFADPLILNPSSTNGGAGTLDAATGPFSTTNSNTAFSSFLQITGATPSTSNAASFTETGAILLTTFDAAGTNITQHYNIYGEYTISGTGSFNGGSVFTATSATATVNIIGSPGNNTASGLNFSTPTAGGFGVTNGAGQFALGQAVLIAAFTPPTAGGFCSTSSSCTTTLDQTNFGGLFGFNPAPGTNGPSGFFVNVKGPFDLTIGAIQGGQPIATTENVNNASSGAGNTDFITGVSTTGTGACSGTGFSGNCPRGGGALSYQVATIPEPNTLAILSVGLLGLGLVLRRRVGRA